MRDTTQSQPIEAASAATSAATSAAPIVIVGAGPAGLTAALLLARQGVAARVIERRASTSIHPRARGLNVRTMEIYRGLGLEAPIEEAGAALAASRYMLFVETLAGREIRRVPDDDLAPTGDALAVFTPCSWVQCAQDALEPLLLEAARAAGAVVEFGVEALDIAQDERGVTLTTRSVASGERGSLRAQYALAADGAGGRLRATLGIPLVERAVQGHYVNIYFKADLRRLVAGREFALCFVENPDAPGMFLAVNNSDRWLFNADYDPATTPLERFTPDHCRALVRAAVGLPDLAVEIMSILPWDATARYARALGRGRVFLLGDAAHTMPPAGGLGLNTGVADAHNLAWKLALTLRGQATPALLATYEAERLPVAQAVVERAARELEAERPDAPPDGEDGGLEGVLAPMLGFTYASTAVCPESDAPATEGETPRLDLSGRPGTRLPHVWLERAGERLSTLDLIGEGFTLLVGAEGEGWGEGWGEGQSAPVTVYQIGGASDLRDLEGRWPATNGVTASGALLVRPDGIVAWRAARLGDAPGATLAAAVARILGLASQARIPGQG